MVKTYRAAHQKVTIRTGGRYHITWNAHADEHRREELVEVERIRPYCVDAQVLASQVVMPNMLDWVRYLGIEWLLDKGVLIRRASVTDLPLYMGYPVQHPNLKFLIEDMEV